MPAEKYLYPDGSTTLTAVVPLDLKAAILRISRERQMSMSQVVVALLTEAVRGIPVG